MAVTGYEWDEAKRQENLDKHQIDFATIEEFDWPNAVIEQSPRGGELRYMARGFINRRMHTVIYTRRGRNRRIISLRKANPREMNEYDQARFRSST
jgi:uncharacterized DUF497 family protein